MKNNLIKCPVCDHQFDHSAEEFCPACGNRPVQPKKSIKRDYEQEEKDLNQIAQTALNDFRSKAGELIILHLATLAKKKKRLISYDDYGVPCCEKWDSEVEYFYERVLSANAELMSLEAASRKANESLYEYDLYLEDPKDALVNYLNALVDSEIDNTEDIIPEYSSDITPEDYEHFVANILNDAGWVAVVTKGSGDQGVDVVAEKDDFRLAIQCKKYSKPVGNKAVQEAYSGGAFYEANACAVVAPIEYTPAAIELADSLGVHLFHHDDLAGLSITSTEDV